MLPQLLAAVRTLDDLRALFEGLGYRPDDRPAEDGLHSVARWEGFRVLALEHAAPRDAARAAARRLAGAARPGLVAALGGDLLVLAAPRLGAPQSGPLLEIHPRRPEPHALALLAALGPRAGASALEHALRTADVLDTEAVGTRFFTAFRAVLERMSAAAGGTGTPSDRALAALLALTRVLFLYFVQAKGWLDGRPDFLRAQLDDALSRRRHFHRTVLHPLFFGTLDRPPAARTHGARFGRIPYLNGGLFEPHPVERRLGPVLLSNALWRDAFDELFERFRFCVREGTSEREGAVAPDMLGRVFERVMEPRERRRSGTFYTPERLVRQVVAGALAAALASDRLPVTVVQPLLAGHPVSPIMRPPAAAALRAVRILDPAVGSGAFLLGAFDLLTAATRALHPGYDAARLCRVRRRILRENLFGVDLNPVALQLAELRLWLAVVADDPETDIARVAPLPNLNGILRQGDSLLDPLSAARALGVATGRPASLDAVCRARDRVFDARGHERRGALGALRSAELEAARELTADAAARARTALRDLDAAAASPDLFGRRTGLTPAQRRRRRHLRARLADLRATGRDVANGSVPFFSYEVHRPDVLARGGFDAVIGNPPWVRAERLPVALRAALGERFRWWRPGRGPGFGHLPDLSVAFLERALELATPGGAVGLLLPAKLTSSGYAARARAGLVRETSLDCLHRVPDDHAAGFGAAVYPMALVARKAPPAPDARVRLQLDGDTSVTQASLAGGGPWLLVGDRTRRALDALRAAGAPLGTVAPPVLGVKTGADGALTGRLLHDDGAVCRVAFGEVEVALERRVVRPALRGRDVRAFRAVPGRVVLWGYDPRGRPLRRLPPLAAAYVRRVRAALERRADGGGPPWSLFRLRAATARWRVVWADIAREAGAVALDEVDPVMVPLNTCYAAVAPDRDTALAVAGTLNSTWIRVLLRLTADEARGGYRRHNARATAAVPVPGAGPARDRVTTLSRRAHRTGHVDQPDLDRAVADALGLPAEVRAALRALAHDRR